MKDPLDFSIRSARLAIWTMAISLLLYTPHIIGPALDILALIAAGVSVVLLVPLFLVVAISCVVIPLECIRRSSEE